MATPFKFTFPVAKPAAQPALPTFSGFPVPGTTFQTPSFQSPSPAPETTFQTPSFQSLTAQTSTFQSPSSVPHSSSPAPAFQTLTFQAPSALPSFQTPLTTPGFASTTPPFQIPPFQAPASSSSGFQIPTQFQQPPAPTPSSPSFQMPSQFQPSSSSSQITTFQPPAAFTGPSTSSARRRPLAATQKPIFDTAGPEEWRNQVISYVNTFILSLIFPNEEDRKKLLGLDEEGSTRAGLWIEAFTDPSSVDKNYERLEKNGDASLKFQFTVIFTSLYPHFGPDEISKMIAYYASNIVFADIIRTLFPDLPNFIRKDPRVDLTDAIMADVFEANFGALYLASENILRGTGQYNVGSLLAKILNEWLSRKSPDGQPRFDTRYSLGDLKTQVGQIFNRHKGPNGKTIPAPKEVSLTVWTRDENGQTVANIHRKRISVTLGPDQINFLRKHNATFDNGRPVGLEHRYVYEGEGDSIVIASAIAYNKIYTALTAMKVDSPGGKGRRTNVSVDWTESVKAESDIKFFPEEYTTPLRAKMAQDGYDEVRFTSIHKLTIEGHQFVTTLQGIKLKPDGSVLEQNRLSTGISKGQHIRARRDAIERYIGRVIVLNKTDSKRWAFDQATDE